MRIFSCMEFLAYIAAYVVIYLKDRRGLTWHYWAAMAFILAANMFQILGASR